MSLRAPSQQQIADQIDVVLQRMPDARLIGIRSPTRQSWPKVINRGERRFRLLWCDSGLELRERLAELDDGNEQLVVLTSLSDEALGPDLLARFARAQLLQPNSWTMLRTAFRARDVDPRLGSEEWIAELLLEHAPPQGYPPVAGSLLDADTAWRHVLAHAMGFEVMRPDVESLLEWTLDETGIERFCNLSEDIRKRIISHLEEIAGAGAGLIMGAVESGQGGSALSLGLVLGVVFADRDERELRDAAVRLEPVFGRRIAQEPSRQLALATGRMIGRIDRAKAEECQHRAAEWLERMHIDGFARLSEHVAIGFDQRLQDAAQALRAAVEGNGPLTRATEAVERIFSHQQARLDSNRAERARMALRLVSWLATPERTPTRLAEAAEHYAREGGFVDLARTVIFAGDQLADVSAVYISIVDRATERRERENEAFARALERWNRDGAASEDVVPVEDFLDSVLAPIAAKTNVLLIVLDGLSHAVHRRLMDDYLRSGWIELVPEHRIAAPLLIAALPSLTDVSRTSLLSGRLTRGQAYEERIAIAKHPALVTASRAGKAPLLFHKAALNVANGVAEELRSAVADPLQRIVAVVHNVVDAQLAGSDQLDIDWSLDELRLIRALLRGARDVGRIVIVAGDHGHVLDRGSTQHVGDGGDRWRRADGLSQSFELTFEGGRVLSPDGERRVILPWSETVRYGAKRRGYHGGATPQEIVAPIAVLTAETVPADWTEAPPVEPDWWQQPAPVPASPPTKPERKPTKPRGQQPRLFYEVEDAGSGNWINRLLASSTYAAQKRLAGRTALKDEDITRLLQALDERGGRLSQTALAQALRQPVIRMSGMVSAAARVLNVDQSPILHFDRVSETVAFDRMLLERQFELGNY